jgi:NAD dependent epimerase/dehydratase
MELQDKRILVTGADGFIGSWLVDELVKAGARVTALVYYNSFNSWGWLEDLDCISEVEVIAGDVRDPHFCLTLTKGKDLVFHLAALIPIPYSYRAPDSYVDTNVKGTLNICQAVMANGVAKVVHTSTSEVYGTAQRVPIDELHPLSAQSPYSASKIGADAIALSFHRSFDLPLVIARPFNTYGPRQSARAVIPTIVAQIAAGKREIQLGDLRPTRDFTFVEDTCRGLLAVAGMENGLGEVFNIGSNQEISIGELLCLIGDVMEVRVIGAADQSRLRPPNSEVLRLRCDNRKLREASGFEPRIGIREGLARTVEWFRDPSHLRRYKENIYNV